MSKFLKDAQGFKYVVLELKLNDLETMYSERHRAILAVEEDMRKLSGGYYEFPDLIEVIEKEGTKQYGIVQKISVETIEELLKAFLSIKKVGLIKEEENLEGLELIKNKEKEKKAEELELIKNKAKKAEEKKKKLSIKQKEVKEVQKTIFGDVKEEEAEVEKGSDEDTEEVINDNDCESNFFDEEEE